MPFLEEHRDIDGVEHVWLGDGWVAVKYAQHIVWNIQAESGHPNVVKGGLRIVPIDDATVPSHGRLEKAFDETVEIKIGPRHATKEIGHASK